MNLPWRTWGDGAPQGLLPVNRYVAVIESAGRLRSIAPTKVAALAAQSTISCAQLLEFEPSRRVLRCSQQVAGLEHAATNRFQFLSIARGPAPGDSIGYRIGASGA